MGLSFGHIHIGKVHIDVAARVLNAVAAYSHFARPSVGYSVTLAQTSKEQSPAQNSGDDDQYCAICGSIFLASTSFVAEPPKLPVPVGFERIAQTFGAEHDIAAPPRRALFQSRAPPAA
jgi:hypothetical protein